MLRAAVGVFSAEGYDGGSLERIARAVGIRKPSLLHRFGSKEALYLECVGLVLGRLGEMVGLAALGDHDPPERLDELSRTMTRYLSEEPHAAPLLFREAMDRGPFISGPGRAAFETVLSTAVQFLEEGRAAGHFDFEDAADAVMSITGVHLTYFTIPDLSAQLSGDGLFGEDAIVRRTRSVIEQVRRICGVQ